MFLQIVSLVSLLSLSQAGLLLNRGNENGGYGYEGIAAASEGNLNDGNGYGEVGLASNGQGHGGIGIRYGGHGNGISLTEGSGLALGGKAAVDYWAPPKYEYKYIVQDPHTGDYKEKEESRIDDLTKSQWAWAEKDRQVKESRVFASSPVKIVGKY